MEEDEELLIYFLMQLLLCEDVEYGVFFIVEPWRLSLSTVGEKCAKDNFIFVEEGKFIKSITHFSLQKSI